MSQVLPVLAQCSFAPKGATLLFEQPELHLHPAAAKKMASVLVSAAMAKGLHIISETHSKDLFIGLMDEIRAGNLAVDDIAAYKVRRVEGQSFFSPIKIELEDGQPQIYDPWQDDL